MHRIFRQALSSGIRRARLFLRDDRGFLISTEWMFWATIVAIGTIGAVMALRYAAREVFVNTAVGIASEQHYEFQSTGTGTEESDPQGIGMDRLGQNSMGRGGRGGNGHVGYAVRTTPNKAWQAFDKLGEVPGEMWETPPKGESKSGGSGQHRP